VRLSLGEADELIRRHLADRGLELPHLVIAVTPGQPVAASHASARLAGSARTKPSIWSVMYRMQNSINQGWGGGWPSRFASTDSSQRDWKQSSGRSTNSAMASASEKCSAHSAINRVRNGRPLPVPPLWASAYLPRWARRWDIGYPTVLSPKMIAPWPQLKHRVMPHFSRRNAACRCPCRGKPFWGRLPPPCLDARPAAAGCRLPGLDGAA
jgi:hypothetical protein